MEPESISSPAPKSVDIERCKECRQILGDPDLKIFTGDSDKSVSYHQTYIPRGHSFVISSYEVCRITHSLCEVFILLEHHMHIFDSVS